MRGNYAATELGLFGSNLQGYFFVKTSCLVIFYESYIFLFTISFGNMISEDFWVVIPS